MAANQVLRIAASLGRISGANANGGNDGTNTQQLSRTAHDTGRFPVEGARVVLGNVRLKGSAPFGEEGVGNSITYQSAMEYDGIQNFQLFGGNPSVVVPDKTLYIGDPSLDIPANSQFFVENYLTVADTTKLWPRAQTVLTGAQYAKKGTNLLSQFTAPGPLSGTPQDGPNPPIAILGMVDRASVAILYTGDSIGDNTGDIVTLDALGTVGFMGRSTRGVDYSNIPHCKLSRAGETLAGMVGSTGALRRSLIPYCTHYGSQLGVNDISGGADLATMKANYLQEWADARAGGAYKIFRTTLTPETTAAGNDFSTLANQSYKTGFEPGGVKDQLNLWFRSCLQEGLIDYLIDVAADCSDPTDPNKWRVDLGAGNNTLDGTHPEWMIHSLMALRLNRVIRTFRTRYALY